MFDFLKGGKADLKLTLDRPFKPYFLGETVRAIVAIEGQKDLQVREGRIALLYQEEYQYRHERRERDSDGHTRTSIETAWTTNEQEVARHVFIHEGVIAGGSIQTFEFAAPIPTQAPPTCEGGRIVRIKWLVKATLDRKMAADINAETEVLVFTMPPGQMSSPDHYGYSNEPGEAELAFSIPGKEWLAGGVLQGELIVRPQKNFEATEVRVEFQRREYVPRDEGHEHVEAKQVKLAGKAQLQAGQTLTYPFSLDILASTPPTMHAPNSSVTWTLKGILARSLRADTRVEEEIFVYSGRPEM